MGSTVEGGRRLRRLLAASAVVVAAACGGDGGTGPGGDGSDPALAPFVGDWRATAMVVTNKANPSIAPDIIEEFGAEFTLNVQPSGQYTARLLFMLTSSVEFGRLSVSGNTVILERSFPAPPTTSTATYQFSGNQLTLDGDSEFDFNNDQIPEAVQAHIVLVKR